MTVISSFATVTAIGVKQIFYTYTQAENVRVKIRKNPRATVSIVFQLTVVMTQIPSVTCHWSVVPV